MEVAVGLQRPWPWAPGPWALLWVVLGCLGSLFAGFLGVPGASEPSFLASAHLNWEGIQQTGQLRQVPTLP